MNNMHYLDGQWLSADDMKISVFDLALSRGLAVFDTLRTYQGIPFMLEDHIERLFKSAEMLQIKIPKSKTEIADLVVEGIKKTDQVEAVIKIVATMGENEGRLTSSKPSFAILILPLHTPSTKDYKTGMRLISAEIKRTLPEAKTIDYVSAKLALMKADDAGVDDVVYVEGENILETTISNIFFIKDKELFTPPLDGILEGITRRVIFELAVDKNYIINESPIRLKDIKKFDEAFTCSSIKEIMPVIEIDGDLIGDGKVGDFSKKIMKEYKDYCLQLIKV